MIPGMQHRMGIGSCGPVASPVKSLHEYSNGFLRETILVAVICGCVVRGLVLTFSA